MIHICDLICRNMSHEKVNSGFIYGLRLAFPNEKIVVYADKSHIDALDNILKVDGIDIGNLEYIPINISNQSSFFYYPKYYFLLKNIFKNVLRSSNNRLFFLSFNKVILHIVKKLKRHYLFAELKFTLVLHGELETIAPSAPKLSSFSLPSSSIISRLARYPIYLWPKKLFSLIARKISGTYQNKISTVYDNWLSLKEVLYFEHSDDYKYIALSSHIIDNAQEHIDIDILNISLVTMPNVFADPAIVVANEYPKFAIFGYGNSEVLAEILTRLSSLGLTNPYEVRNISMNNRGISDFKNLTLTSNGSPLHREEMERHAKDIDIFLILHQADSYRLSCSASIFEALSYKKPIIHFDSSCMNTYNTDENPIGYRVSTIDQFAKKMADIIDNYSEFLSDRDEFSKNIFKVRERCSIERSVKDIKSSFTWIDEIK